MGWIDWRTLSPRAVTSLHSSFTSVKELELEWISFTLPEFFRLIDALTALEKITISSGVPFDTPRSTIDTVQISHSRLRQLVFSDPQRGWMVDIFARAIRYTSGITSVSVKTYYNSEELKACGELLATAGKNLRGLKLRVYSASSPGADSIFSQLLALPHNANLEEIHIEPVDESTIVLLLQGLKMHAKPRLSRLKLGLNGAVDLGRWTGADN
ncbi:hypothetical protein C0992_012654 [Termitomyces sp. T32_za158]|nr:hypothetical protein C0992_012654 [Termitomyces sp. T32_za158]